MEIKQKIKVSRNFSELKMYFEYLMNNPNKYQFDTHQGFFPLTGRIDKIGARFYTQEIFFIVPIRIYFKTVEISKNVIKFILLKPFGFLNIFVEFSIDSSSDDYPFITLKIESQPRNLTEKVLGFPLFHFPIKNVIENQLKKELDFISKNIAKGNYQ